MSVSISFRKVSFGYARDRLLFTHLDLLLADDKTVILSGENGTGKSTLAALAAGFLKPASGSISYGSELRKSQQRRVLCTELAYLSQATEDNIICPTPADELALWMHSGFEKTKTNSITPAEILFDWGLEDIADKPVWELSSGEQKCLALAGICLHPQRYWILDEPLVSLDLLHAEHFLKKLTTKQRVSRGMLIISHNPAAFAGLADELLLLKADGNITVK